MAGWIGGLRRGVWWYWELKWWRWRGTVEGWPIWVREAGLGFVGVGDSNEEGAVRGEECVKMDVGLTGVEKVF